ncbi:MAG: hypothetical protein ABSG68_09075 [Thermoguttaceae bacterium]|jgi:Leucine-rich repeat (LRR) protein
MSCIISAIAVALVAAASLPGVEISVPEPDDPSDVAALKQIDGVGLYLSARRSRPRADARDVQRLTLRGAPDDIERALPHLKGLHSVREFEAGICTTDAVLAAITRMRELQTIDLSFSRVTDDGLRHLVGLPCLRNLALPSSKRITDAGLANLATIRKLESLSLDGTAVTSGGLSNLAGLKSLHWLNLSGTDISDDGLRHLQGLKLELLRVCQTRITNRGIQMLKDMTTLRELDVAGTDTTAAALAYLKRIKGLYVRGLDSNAQGGSAWGK